MVDISVLGGLSAASSELALDQKQPLLLLSYLAHEGPKSRQHLASMFWSHAKSPLNNLSSALSRINAAAPGALSIDTERVSTHLRTDAQVVRQALARGELDAALDSYGGAFLDGVSLRHMGLELEEWIFLERESIAAALAQPAATKASELLDLGRAAESRTLAERAFEVACDGMPDVRLLSHCFHVLDRVGSATVPRIKQLATNLGFDLLSAAANPADAEKVHDLDREVNPTLIGRANELRDLRTSLAEARFVAVTGMGGVGKTSLVQTLADEREDAGDDVVWVSLGGVKADDIVPRIADAVGGGLISEQDLLVQVADRWMGKQPLLVLDNLDRPDELAAWFNDLLAAVPTMDLVVTTRRRPTQSNARPLQVTGLSLGGGTSGGEAYELFERCAQRSCPGFPTGDADRLAAVKFCTRVRGLPLAIEVGAAMLDMVSVEALADGLVAGSPEGAVVDVVGEVLQQSWVLLDLTAQTCLRALAVFSAAFSLDAAIDVAGAGISTLRKLVDQSLLTVLAPDRFEIHPVAAAFVRMKSFGDEPALEARFADYCVRRLHQAVLEGLGLDGELADIAAAWRLAVASADPQLIRRMTEPLHEFLQRTNRLHLAHGLFAMALDLPKPNREVAIATAEIANNHAWTAWRRGNLGQAHASLALATSLADPNDRRLAIRLSQTEATIALSKGDPEGALIAHRRAAELIDDTIDPLLAVRVLEGMGECARIRGEIDQARSAFRRALELGREHEDAHLLARSYLQLGSVERLVNPDRAVVLLDEGLTIAAQHDLVQLMGLFPVELGYAHLARGDHRDAERWFNDAIAVAQNDEAWIRSYIETGLARVLIETNRLDEAEAMLAAALRSARSSADWPTLIEALLGICELHIATRRADSITGFLVSIIEHPAAEVSHVEAARAMLDDGAPAPVITAELPFDEAAELAAELLRFG